jgi:hypothetical protein
MNRKEAVYREIGCSRIRGQTDFTQLALSRKLGLSLSVVNSAVTDLRDVNAVRVKQRSFEVIALDRLLLYWATHRVLKKDIAYQTRASMPVKEMDAVAFTGYTAYKLLFGEVPADYSELYVYATDAGLNEIRRRFKANDRIPNITVLKCDRFLEAAITGHELKNSSVCEAQLFADLWNMGQWYAKDFVDALSKRLGI